LLQQVDQLQAELQSRGDTAEHLQQALQTAQAARQRAADELSQALDQQRSVQVGHYALPLPF